MRKTIMAGLAWLLTSTSIAVAQAPGAPSGAAATYEAGPFSVSAEALILWFKGASTSTSLVSTGILGEPGTKVLLGGQDLDTNPNPGFRLTAGYSLTERGGEWRGASSTCQRAPPAGLSAPRARSARRICSFPSST